jgi:hypothetical protein
MERIIKTFNLVNTQKKIQSTLNETFHLVKNDSFDLVKFDLPTPSRYKSDKLNLMSKNYFSILPNDTNLLLFSPLWGDFWG